MARKPKPVPKNRWMSPDPKKMYPAVEHGVLIVWLELNENETRRLAVGEMPEAVRTHLVTVARDTLKSLDLGPATWARGDDGEKPKP